MIVPDPAEAGRELARAWRALTRRPGFAVAAIVTLALGIAGPTAIFTVVQAVLLRPLPYPEADRLIRFRIEGRGPDGSPMSFDALPVDAALTWRDRSNALASIALFNDRALTLTTPTGPYRLVGIAATPNLFDVLGVTPHAGRLFDETMVEARPIVLSHETWVRHFQADPAAVGTSVLLDGERWRVVGVMPPGFGFPTPDAAFWVPQPLALGGSRGMVLPAVARLAPGATLAAVEQESGEVLADTGLLRNGARLVVQTMRDQLVGGVRRLLWVLLGAVGLVFVIATTNVALLQLARGVDREREYSLRLAIGAGRGRIVRQILVETALLASVGGAAGVGLSAVALDAILALAPPDLPRLRDAGLDARVVGFAALLAVGASLVFGALSAGSALRADPIRALGRLGGDSSTAGSRGVRRRLIGLAVAEVALTMVLLVGAGLLIRSFVRLARVDHGFDSRGALAMQIALPAARYSTPTARQTFHLDLLARLRALPGVQAAGTATAMPNRQGTGRFAFGRRGLPLFPDPMSTPVGEVRTVSDGFFEAMGVPVRAGRTFTADDGPAAERAIVINEKLAARVFGLDPPVGEILHTSTGPHRVIGVVGDVKPAAPGRDPDIGAYFTMRQHDGDFRWFATATLVVRSADPEATATTVRALVLAMDPDMPPFNVRTLDDEVAGLVAGPRFAATVLTSFAGLALGLAALGIYGVMAHGAARRTREIGVRMALGATRGDIRSLVLRDGALVVVAGLGTGLVAATWLAGTLTGLLHEVTPADPLAVGSVAALLAATGLLACALPARRATRVSALEALRDD